MLCAQAQSRTFSSHVRQTSTLKEPFMRRIMEEQGKEEVAVEEGALTEQETEHGSEEQSEAQISDRVAANEDLYRPKSVTHPHSNRSYRPLTPSERQRLQLDLLQAPTHEDRADRRSIRAIQDMGEAHHHIYRSTGNITHLEEAIQKYHKAFNLLSPDEIDDLSRANLSQNLGMSSLDKYIRLGKIVDLEKAIEQFRQALDWTSTDHPDRAVRLQNLGNAYNTRFLRIGAFADVNMAIQYCEEALSVTLKDDPDRANMLCDLGNAYNNKYRRSKKLTDLDMAIQNYQEGLDFKPINLIRSRSPSSQAELSRNFPIKYGDNYQEIVKAIEHVKSSKKTTDLDMDIRYHPEVPRFKPINLIRPRTPSSQAELSRNFPSKYGDKYQEIADKIEELKRKALRGRIRYRRAINKPLPGFEDHLERLNFSKECLTTDQEPDHVPAPPNQGSDHVSESSDQESDHNSDSSDQELLYVTDTTKVMVRADRLFNLGMGYNNRYQSTGALVDFEMAIQNYREALALIRSDPDRAHRAGWLESFGSAYYDRFQKTNAMEDLEVAIQKYQEALDLTPVDHPGRAARFHKLGIGYNDRFKKTGALQDLEIAIQKHQQALDHSPASVSDHLEAGRSLLALHAGTENWPQAYQAASKTLSLVPLLTHRSLETSDKQHLVTEIVDFASSASAIALNADNTPYSAIQALEIGRGVITGSLNELRADVSDLQQKHPAIAEEYMALRGQLDAPITLTQFRTDQRYSASQRLERKIQQIRQLPNFDRFLLAPSEDDLKTAAKCGPIVIINVSEYRCDALIIEKNKIRALHLPHLHSSDIQDRATKTLAEVEILEWLWDTVTEPILDMLGFTQTPSSRCWPHIWWIPTGLLAKFPIHAAGRHFESSSDTVLDRVISSYSSTVKTIIHSRRNTQPRTTLELAKATMLAMQRTPKQEDVTFTRQEILELERLCSSMNLQVVKPLPYKEHVLAALNDCKIFHFAGHGFTDPSDPSKSHLLLSDWETEPLTVANLLEINLWKQAPFLAYLSACGTGQVKQDNSIDESLHLISACQLAGFRHVVGTLWKVNDEVCVDMARITYDGMSHGGMTDESICWGLHQATREIRDRWLKAPAKTRSGSTSAREEIASWPECEAGSTSARVRDERYDGLVRDFELDETGPANWVPYVHFGV